MHLSKIVALFFYFTIPLPAGASLSVRASRASSWLSSSAATRAGQARRWVGNLSYLLLSFIIIHIRKNLRVRVAFAVPSSPAADPAAWSILGRTPLFFRFLILGANLQIKFYT